MVNVVMDALTVISIRQLRFYYPNQATPTLKDMDLDIPAGTLMAIVGPNGAGKSTLVKIIAGLLAPSEAKRIALPQRMAYLGQQADIDRHFPITTFQLVSMGLWTSMGAFKTLTAQMREQVHAALREVGLEKFAQHPIDTLSGGQFQRAMFARLILQDASVILLDEPFNAIDQKTVSDLTSTIKKWQSEERTVIVVLHDLDYVKKHFPKTLIIAHDVIAWGDTKTVLTEKNLQHACNKCDCFITELESNSFVSEAVTR